MPVKFNPRVEVQKTIQYWIEEHSLDELTAWIILSQVVADFPENIRGGLLIKLKNVRSINRDFIRLKSLSQREVNVTLWGALVRGFYVSKEDHYASQEVRDYVDENDDFFGMYIDTKPPLKLVLISN